MDKNFDGWNQKKKSIHERVEAPFYHEREIWWCTLGTNIGSEQDGSGEEYRRLVIVLKGLGVRTCLVIPLTTSTRTHRLRPAVGLVADKTAHALLSQMRTVDTKRLVRKIGQFNKSVFEDIRKAVKDML